jgi:O-antigen/teichoic acid export membrane protein
LATAVAALAALAVTPVLLHHLGESAYGVWALATSLVGYLELLELGFGAAGTKLMAEDAGKRPEEVSKTLSTSLVVLAGTGLLALVIGLILALGAPHWFAIPKGMDAATTAVILSLAVGLAVSIPGDAFGGALAAYQRYDLRSLTNLILVVATTAATFALVYAGRGLVAIAVATAIISILLHPIRWAMLRTVDPEIRIGRGLISRQRLGIVSRFSGWFLLADLANLASYSADVVIIGAVLGIKDVALYTIGSKLSLLAQKALSEASGLLLPEASSLSRDGSTSAVADLLVDGTRVTMLAGIPLSLVMGVLARPAVRAWVGPGYDRAAVVLMIFSVYTGLRTVVNPVESVVIGTGKVRPWALSMTAQAVVNVAVTLALVSTIGLPGPALGTIAGAVLIVGPVFVIVGCQAAELPVSTFLRRTIVPHLAPSAVLTVYLIAIHKIAEHGRLTLIVLSLIGIVMYGITYYFAGANPTERNHLRTTLGRLIPALRPR